MKPLVSHTHLKNLNQPINVIPKLQMSNLRSWGYTNNRKSVPFGLLEKINKLKVEINKLRDNLDNEGQLDE
jgi:hypothetical protein